MPTGSCHSPSVPTSPTRQRRQRRHRAKQAPISSRIRAAGGVDGPAVANHSRQVCHHRDPAHVRPEWTPTEQLEGLQSGDANAVLLGHLAQAALVTLDTLDHQPLMVLQHASVHCVSLRQRNSHASERGVSCVLNNAVGNAEGWDSSTLPSRAQPSQSKPGPRLATVAGAETDTLLTLGSSCARTIWRRALRKVDARGDAHGGGGVGASGAPPRRARTAGLDAACAWLHLAWDALMAGRLDRLLSHGSDTARRRRARFEGAIARRSSPKYPAHACGSPCRIPGAAAAAARGRGGSGRLEGGVVPSAVPGHCVRARAAALSIPPPIAPAGDRWVGRALG
eukprot:scaffold565_cov358-Prasinococcus_capsulatus_cf.AAC.5